MHTCSMIGTAAHGRALVCVPRPWRINMKPCAATATAKGLYGLGVDSPDDWPGLVAEVRQACMDVAQRGHINWSILPDGAQQRQHQMIINLLRLPALHTSQHHPETAWRRAAQQACDQLATLESVLSGEGLEQETEPEASPGEVPGAQAYPADLDQIHAEVSSAQKLVSSASSLPNSTFTSQIQQPPTAEPTAESGQTPLQLSFEQQIQLAQAAEQQLRAALERLLTHAPSPLLVLHASEVEGDAGLAPYLAPLPLPNQLSSGKGKAASLVRSLAAVMRSRRGRGRRVWQFSTRRSRAATRQKKQRLRYAAYLMRMPGSQRQSPPRARLAKAAGLVPAGAPVVSDLTTLCQTSEALTLWARSRTRKSLCISFGPRIYATRCAASVLNSWWLSQSKYRKAGGATAAAQQQDAAADLFTLRLDQPFALQLLRAHPQPALRRAVYQAAVMPRVRATLQAAGMLVGIRQHIAQALGAPSYAHLQLASSSPGPSLFDEMWECMPGVVHEMLQWHGDCVTLATGGPCAVSAFLKELAQALDELVAEQLGAGAALLASAGHLPSSCPKLRAWDVEAAIAQVAELHTQGTKQANLRGSGKALLPLDWSATAPHYSLEGVLSIGLSRVLRPAGLQLQLSPLAPGELWTWPEAGAVQPLKLLLCDLHHQAGSHTGPVQPDGMSLVAVVYVVPGDTTQPFTTLVRPGTHSAASEAACPAVAVHLPASALALVPLRTSSSSTLSLTLLRNPSLLSTLMHEMGHVLSYALSARDAAAEGEPFGCICFGTTDVRELPSHVMERCAYDESTLLALSTSPAAAAAQATTGNTSLGRRGLDSAAAEAPSVTPQVVHSLAAHLAARRKESPLDLQQHAIAALLDVALHAQPPPQRIGVAGPQAHRNALRLMRTAWRRNSTLGQLVITAHTLRILPGLLLNPAGMHAYPTATLLSAAFWQQHSLSDVGRGWAAVRTLLHMPGHMKLHEAAQVLLAPHCYQVVGEAEDADVAGFIPDLTHSMFQDMQL